MKQLNTCRTRLKQALLAAIVTAPLSFAFAEEVTINALTLAPKQASITNPFKMFAEEVNEKYAGKIKINWRGGPEVMPPFKHAEAVRNGSIDMTYTSPSYYGGLVPTSSSMNLSFKDYAAIAPTQYHERMTELHAEKDLVLLGEIPASDLNFLIYLRDPIKSLDELKGLRIRVFPTLLPLVKALGAEPIVLSMGEIFTAMERGAIDGFMQGPVGQAKQFEGVVSQVIYPGVYRAGFPVLVNKDTWSKIPEDVQQSLTSFLREDFAPRVDHIWEEDIAAAAQEMKDAGFELYDLSEADAATMRQTAMDAAWAAMAEGAGEELAAELREMLE
ncbi:MAG: TRAP transporter substrate-binding protein DctP [Granulosicoccus sp.]|nr:TRAP transporter substrate-binding protein DctP [Granulosicoccus sp.]